MLKENKGITLVALVITIIVMLILAGVSISLVVGDNGVLTNATDAVDSNAAAEMKEDIEFAISSASSDCLVEYTTNRNAKITDYITVPYMSTEKKYYTQATSSTSIAEDSYYVVLGNVSNNECTISVTNSAAQTITGILTFSSDLYVSVKWN